MKLWLDYQAAAASPSPTVTKDMRAGRRARVFRTVRPKIDTYRLARAFINLSRTPEGQKMLDEIRERRTKEDALILAVPYASLLTCLRRVS